LPHAPARRPAYRACAVRGPTGIPVSPCSRLVLIPGNQAAGRQPQMLIRGDNDPSHMADSFQMCAPHRSLFPYDGVRPVSVSLAAGRP
jgi:hypothetical protein